MAAKLKRIDERGEVLTRKLAAGLISEAKYNAELRKLVNRVEAILEAGK